MLLDTHLDCGSSSAKELSYSSGGRPKTVSILRGPRERGRGRARNNVTHEDMIKIQTGLNLSQKQTLSMGSTESSTESGYAVQLNLKKP